MTRQFEDVIATRERVPLLVGLCGPSGSGKTYSALRLATGMQRVTGGEVYVIDTEARRARHYADTFKFRHIDFQAPFSPLDYMAAIEHCVRKGAGVVVVDSMSHEHEGPGGVLEWHERELVRMAGGDDNKRERVNMLAWAAPKQARRRLINTILQLGVNAVFCFRAKEKIRMPKRGEKDREIRELGWMPIAGEEFVYEMTVNCLLYPGSGGVPSWAPELPGEKQMTKLPSQFVALFEKAAPLSEEIGAALASWAAGDAKAPAAGELEALLADIGLAPTLEELAESARANARKGWTPDQRAQIKRAIDARQAQLKAPADGGAQS